MGHMHGEKLDNGALAMPARALRLNTLSTSRTPTVSRSSPFVPSCSRRGESPLCRIPIFGRAHHHSHPLEIGPSARAETALRWRRARALAGCAGRRPSMIHRSDVTRLCARGCAATQDDYPTRRQLRWLCIVSTRCRRAAARCKRPGRSRSLARRGAGRARPALHPHGPNAERHGWAPAETTAPSR